MKFNVHIEETLAKDIIVEADSSFEANSIIRERINNGEIVLTSDDFTGCRIIQACKYGDKND